MPPKRKGSDTSHSAKKAKGKCPIDHSKYREGRAENDGPSKCTWFPGTTEKSPHTQESRFVDLLEQLEEEQATLSAQVVQLESEVESIARNERLISMLEARQRTLESAERFKVGSLDQLTGALERKRTEQEAELDRLAAGVDAASYVDLAERELSAESRQRD